MSKIVHFSSLNDFNKWQLFIWRILSGSRIMKKYYKGFTNSKNQKLYIKSLYCYTIFEWNERTFGVPLWLRWYPLNLMQFVLSKGNDSLFMSNPSERWREKTHIWIIILYPLLFALSFSKWKRIFCPLDKIWNRKGVVIYGNICF